MPSKFRVKNYIRNGIYHIFNRGIEGRDIFRDGEDFNKFIGLIKSYVYGTEDMRWGRIKINKPVKNNLEGEVEVIAYCLMPNHYHLLLRQINEDSMTKLIRRVNTAYGMYFNKKYQRRGTLWESIYRAALVDKEEVAELTKYLHWHPVERLTRRFGPVVAVSASRPEDYSYSSYHLYVGTSERNWVNTGIVSMTPEKYRIYMNQPQAVEKLASKVMLFD